MKKVLIIQPWIRLGGAETLAIQLSDKLNDIPGLKSSILTLFVDKFGLPECHKNLTVLLPYKPLSRMCEKSPWFRFVFGPIILLAISLCKSSAFDFLNPHNAPSHWVAAINKIFFRKPILWTCNEPVNKLTLGKFKFMDYLGSILIDNALDKLFVRLIDNIIVLDEKNQVRIKEKYGRRAVIVNSGIDFDFFQKSYSIEKTRKKFHIPKNKTIFLCVGSLVPQKNQIVAIRALELTKKTAPDFLLIIAGSGQDRINLEKYARSNNLTRDIIFTGRISNEKLSDLYHLCDAVIFPAINQSWGLTPLEALCSKKLSIVSSDSGISEIIAKNNIGLVSDPDEYSFSKKMIAFYKLKNEHPLNYEDTVSRGQLIVKSNYTWKEYAKKYAEIMLCEKLKKRL